MPESRLVPGHYVATAKYSSLGKGEKGEYIKLDFEVVEPVDYQCEMVSWYGSFSFSRGKDGKTPFERTLETLRICGWKGNDLSDLSGMGDNSVSINVDLNEYNGKMYPAVKWVNKPGETANKNALSVEQSMSFAERMKAKIIAIEAGKPPIRETSSLTGRSVPESDKVPF